MTADVQPQNLYKVLGVRSDANQKEINEAYERMIRRFDSSVEKFSYAVHPSLKERIALVQEAYDTLSNDKKRSAYNQSIIGEGDSPVLNSAQAAGRQMKMSLYNEKKSNG
ncbi:uncharacterized protein METZ01_LOCUS322804, partial [marine metagenome]